MSRLQRIAQRTEAPMAVLALLVIPALVMEDRALTSEVRTAGVVLNWIIWLAFVAEFIVRWTAAGTASFPRRAWFDLLLIVLTPPFGVPDVVQGIRSLRVLRLLRLLRAFGLAAMALRLGRRHLAKQKFHYVLAVAASTVVLGALGVYILEIDENKNISTFGDALWWAASTVTTVGYGDVTPVTPEGRLIAVVLMLVGIGVIGVFTAMVASFLFEHEHQTESAQLAARLDVIERKLDELLRK
jgi:voltage-gated potassium channel